MLSSRNLLTTDIRHWTPPPFETTVFFILRLDDTTLPSKAATALTHIRFHARCREHQGPEKEFDREPWGLEFGYLMGLDRIPVEMVYAVQYARISIVSPPSYHPHRYGVEDRGTHRRKSFTVPTTSFVKGTP